jgi:hypothetical protein
MHVEQCYVRHGVLGQSLQFGAGGECGRTQAMLRQAFGDDLSLECLVFDQNDLRRAVQAGFSLISPYRGKQVNDTPLRDSPPLKPVSVVIGHPTPASVLKLCRFQSRPFVWASACRPGCRAPTDNYA